MGISRAQPSAHKRSMPCEEPSGDILCTRPFFWGGWRGLEEDANLLVGWPPLWTWSGCSKWPYIAFVSKPQKVNR